MDILVDGFDAILKNVCLESCFFVSLLLPCFRCRIQLIINVIFKLKYFIESFNLCM